MEELLCWLLNAHDIDDVRHSEMHTAKPLGPEPSCFEVELN